MDINMHALHPGQQQVYDERSRFNVLSCGRRFGKTDLSYPLISEVINFNVVNDTNYDMAYMAPTYKNLKPVWRKFCNVFKSIISSTSAVDYTATILDRFVIEFWSLDKPENIRGREYIRCIIDEAALIGNLKDIFKMIILPTLGTLQGDAWFFSTPRGFNDFYYYYALGQNPLFDDWMSWIMPTSANPHFPAEELEAQRKLTTPDAFAQEWEGKFVSLGNSPFNIENFKEKTYDTIEQCLTALNQKPVYKIRYWDIANSENGDNTASVLVTTTDEPNFILSKPVAFQGEWGTNYGAVKNIMLSEPDVLHMFETEGVGGVAWWMIQQDADLASINKMPAGRVFTKQKKTERANLWAIELNSHRMCVIRDLGYLDMLEEIAAFPNGSHDDRVDSISGAFLTYIWVYNGYAQLMDAKKIPEQTVRDSKIDYHMETILLEHADLM